MPFGVDFAPQTAQALATCIGIPSTSIFTLATLTPTFLACSITKASVRSPAARRVLMSDRNCSLMPAASSAFRYEAMSGTYILTVQVFPDLPLSLFRTQTPPGFAIRLSSASSFAAAASHCS